jgi:hypothetical protein
MTRRKLRKGGAARSSKQPPARGKLGRRSVFTEGELLALEAVSRRSMF